ncbi:MAG TPA: (d)CMP kinase [Pirellulales bacterium]|nr:(d)CMP kinase [Pirellulales bacterium]
MPIAGILLYMIVAIDGPAGAGKSSAARTLAHRLGFRFLDTGAMYRAVALSALRRKTDLDDAAALARLAREIDISLPGDRVLLDREDVTHEIRTLAVTSVTHHAANNPAVREHLVELQRQIAAGKNVVTEGRDQGTVVFPAAECKIFLTASPSERARRRLLDLQEHGETVTLDEVLADQNERDRRDANRDVGPLKPAADAIEVNTDGLSPDEVVNRLESLVRARMA